MASLRPTVLFIDMHKVPNRMKVLMTHEIGEIIVSSEHLNYIYKVYLWRILVVSDFSDWLVTQVFEYFSCEKN